MVVKFSKYQGTGNDFILVDNREKQLSEQLNDLFRKMCDRRFGIGADGLILLNHHDGCDFEMKYYNSDGKESTMCGNGGRCIVRFAKSLGIIDKKVKFAAVDGLHEAVLEKPNVVSLKMKNVAEIREVDGDFLLDTGSPHYVRFVEKVDDHDVNGIGRKIRSSDDFAEKGINVNFVEMIGGHLKVRTYERGVEAETLSCGTGVVASAVAAAYKYHMDQQVRLDVKTPGGKLEVSFERWNDKNYGNVWLKGPAEFVFKGVADLSKL